MSYVPLLETELLAVVLGFGTGVALGNGGKDFDRMVQETEWFKKLSKFKKWLVKMLLDLTHHFQYGLILMLYARIYLESTHPTLFWIVYSLGFGLVVTDIKDVPRRFRRFFGVEEK